MTKPFKFEGKKRQSQAERGLEELRGSVDTVITIPNERLLATIARTTSLNEAFTTADDVLRQAIQGISDLILVPGMINLDFADVKTIMAGMGIAIMGTGVGEGDGRAMTAANHAVSSPLLEDASVKGARGVIINVTGGPDLSLIEVSEASAIIQEAAHEEANIIFGAVVDPKMEGRVKITVIATGFDRVAAVKQVTASAANTPVDMQSYTAYQQTEKIAASGGGGRVSIAVPTAGATPAPPPAVSMPISRRAVLEMPVPAAAAAGDPANDTFSPGAEFEPVSPLDVPAFLRRQNEG